ncbi:hypothetical protein [Alteromonas sp. CYL-A6]|uniref:hypothetical protein n=1 Tax=Alteromonas nitratireducens TaxID=3390813 RepID=UPI0034BD8928
MRIIGPAMLALLVSGCASFLSPGNQTTTNLPESPTDVVVLDDNAFCLVADETMLPHNCDARYWVALWVKADNTAWPERKRALSALGSTLSDKLHRIILSIPVDTPYQDRLRAQTLLNEVTSSLTPQAQRVATTLLAQPNQQMLEFESAITLLSRVNTRQANSIDVLKNELELQQKKLEELLQIEATLMDKSRSNQQ